MHIIFFIVKSITNEDAKFWLKYETYLCFCNYRVVTRKVENLKDSDPE